MNCKTKKKIPFRRVGNTYFMDAWVKVPDKSGNGKNDMDVDIINGRSPGFIRQSKP